MLRTRLFQLSSHQEHFQRHGSKSRPSVNSQVTTGTHTLGALRSKVSQVMKLLIVVMDLANQLPQSHIWQTLESLLMEDHSDHAQTQLKVGQLTSKSIGNRLESSLLQAITSCYKSYLSIANKELQDDRHLARLRSSNTFATKSYWQHQQAVHQHARGAPQSFGSSDAVAPLITRILARLINPSCLPMTACILMLESGLPEAVLELVEEARYFDHYEVRIERPRELCLKKQACVCCQIWHAMSHSS